MGLYPLVSAFTAPEERTEARSLSGRARQDRDGDGTMGNVSALLSAFTAPVDARKRDRFPRGSRRRSHHGEYTRFAERLFIAPEEHTKARSFSGRAHQDRDGDSTIGMCPPC